MLYRFCVHICAPCTAILCVQGLSVSPEQWRKTTLFRVVVPLSVPGIMSGVTMVFVPAISTFIISRMLGGGSNLLIGDLIEMQFLGNAYNPHLGAGISLVLMVIILLIMTIMNQFNPDDQVLI